jgi:hypothetical protein
MRLIIEKSKLKVAPERVARLAGYAYLPGRGGSQDSFIRVLARSGYPRFHLYINQEDDKIIFNLHLDQKRPSYAGAAAHNAEYNGQAVEAEMERIKTIVSDSTF